MFTKYMLPVLAVAGLAFAIYTVVLARQAPPPATPYIEPPARPLELKRVIAGAGLIEARQENIPIGANIPGVVTELFVKVHDEVKLGTPLFRTDDRSLKAELKVRESNAAAARAQLERLKAAPQQQDIPTAQAAVEEARARFYEAEIVFNRTSQLQNRGVSSASDLDRDRHAFQAAKAALTHTEADLARIKVTWAKDIEVAQAQVEQAASLLDSTKTDLERCTVRALVSGEVLQVNVRPGQYAAIVWKEPLIVLGDINTLHVRVDIDEQDLPLFDKDAEAFATLKGRPEDRFRLTRVVKIEPYVIPKRSLTGDNSERVDTRVLQVVYALEDDRRIPLYVGQQMDVYLRAGLPPAGSSLKAGPDAKKPFESDGAPGRGDKDSLPALHSASAGGSR